MPAKTPGRKTYRTMRGKQIDMDMLRKKNELTPAVGNARVNARGDLLGPGGKIVKKREEMMKSYYKDNPNAQAKADRTVQPPAEPVPEAVEPEVTFKKQKKTTQPKVEAPSASEQAELDAMEDQWVEDADGNFVPKGE
jgi:hypothetical protein